MQGHWVSAGLGWKTPDFSVNSFLFSYNTQLPANDESPEAKWAGIRKGVGGRLLLAQSQQPSDVCSSPGRLFPLRLRIPRYSLSWRALEWFDKGLALSAKSQQAEDSVNTNFKKVSYILFVMLTYLRFDSSVGWWLVSSSQGVKAWEQKSPLRIRFETRRPAALSSQPELTSRAFDQNRINREEARCYCSAGFGFSPNTFTVLQYNTQQDFMYHTEQRAPLMHWVINHSGPAPSLFISLAIYQIQRFNSFTNLPLLIQAGETTVCPPQPGKSKFVWDSVMRQA